MPLTWSIANGIGAGVIAHVVLMTFAGSALDLADHLGGAAAFATFFAAA